MKYILLLSTFLVLIGCSTDNKVTINTQAHVTTEVNARLYQVEVSFAQQAKEQAQALSQLKRQIASFEDWVGQQGWQVRSDAHSLRPLYHYPPSQPRQQTGYEVTQGFSLSSLSFEEYQQVLVGVSQFEPKRVQRGALSVDPDMKKQAVQDLIAKGLNQAREKAQAIAQAGNLCQVSLLSVDETVQSVQPRMMSMASSDQMEKLHESEAVQSLSLTLQVVWHAQPCS
ncbi:SIMPL domain-containing protein [Bermanella sp. R86510]|uniref:SIMPL domain-containing protein n=1 Tax=unclassified Bermanella TaxID=2627862 RepID=UPI0037C611B3